MIFTTAIFVAAAVVGTNAQQYIGNGYNLSPTCQAAAASVLAGPAGTCLGVPGLMNIAMTPSDQSIVGPVDTWLTTTCSQPACDNSTIDAAVVNITTGCQSDLTLWGAGNVDVQTIESYVEKYYPVTREVVCLQDTSASNQYCITTTLKSIETYLNTTLSPNNAWKLIAAVKNLGSSAGKDFACTTCTQAAWGLIRPYLDSEPESQTAVDNQLNSLCGAGFTNNTTPSNIIQTAKKGGSGGSNGAVSFSSFGMGSVIALGFAGAIALLL